MDFRLKNVHNITAGDSVITKMIGKIHRRGMIIAALIVGCVPLSAGALAPLVATNANATDFGFFTPGTVLNIGVTGQVNLNGPDGSIVTNPDGSLINPSAESCAVCWFGLPGYTYFMEGSHNYPILDVESDGINHFVGGGGNYDMYPGDHAAFAPEGKPTTNTADPDAIRFGAVAFTFQANPGATDWHPLGYGGTFVVPTGASDLLLVIVDTYYPNNTGGYAVTIDQVTVPEPAAMGLAFSGLLLLGGVRLFRTRRQR